MRCLKRNKQSFYYALYSGKTEIVDEYGNSTGQYEITYAAPVKMYANISAARGTSDYEQFGISATYTKTIATDEMDCPIKEDTILWIDKLPYETIGEVTTLTPHNYIVVGIAKSLNSITIAIREVDVG